MKKHFLPFFPGTFFFDCFQAGMMGAELLSASSEVIAHRTHLIHQAMNGKVSLSHGEFARMWQEKVAAHLEMCENLGKAIPKGKRAKGALSGIQMWNSLVKPYHRKATSNARRLKRGK